jgi:osomolarity two-component system response regulator SSK1
MSNINNTNVAYANTQLQTQQPQLTLSQTQYSALLGLLQQQQAQQLQHAQQIQQQQKKRRVWIKRAGITNAQATTVYVGPHDIVDDLKMLIIQKYPNSLARLTDPADLRVWRQCPGVAAARMEIKPLAPELIVFDLLGPETNESENMNEPFFVDFVGDNSIAVRNSLAPETETQATSGSDGTASFYKATMGLAEPPDSPKTDGMSTPCELSSSPASTNSQFDFSIALNNASNTVDSTPEQTQPFSDIAVSAINSERKSISSFGSNISLRKTALKQQEQQRPTKNTSGNGVILLPRQFKNPASSLSSSSSTNNPNNSVNSYVGTANASTAKKAKNRLVVETSSLSAVAAGSSSDNNSPNVSPRIHSLPGFKSITTNRDESYTRAKDSDPNELVKPSTIRRKQQQQPQEDGGAQGEKRNRRASTNNKTRPTALTKLSAVTVPKKSSSFATNDSNVSNNRKLLLSINKGIAPYTTVVPQINVLIVEDNVINQKILETFLNRRKIRSSTAKNGKEAIEKWKRGGFHLVLMDIQLPVMNGIEATKNIRRLEHKNRIGVFSNSSTLENDGEGSTLAEIDPDDVLDIKLFRSPVIIVALTASSSLADKSEALAAGCNDFLTKPVNLKWLEQKTIEWGCMQALIDFEGWKHWVTRDPTPASTPTSTVSTAAAGLQSGAGKPVSVQRTSQGRPGLEKSRSLSAGRIKSKELAPLTPSLSSSRTGSASSTSSRNQGQKSPITAMTPVTSTLTNYTKLNSSPRNTNNADGYFDHASSFLGNGSPGDTVELHLAPLTPVSPVTGPPSMQNAMGAVLVTSPSAVTANANRQRRAAIGD